MLADTSTSSPIMRIRTTLSALLLLSCSVMHPASAASVEGREILAFFAPPERLREGMAAAIPALREEQPDLAEEIARMPARYDPNEVLDRTGVIFDEKLSAQEKASALAFMKTPAGQAMQKLLGEADPQKRKVLQFGLGPAVLLQIASFTQSPTGKHITALLQSPEVADIQTRYGRELMCGIVKESRPAGFAQLRAEGSCTQ